MPEFYTWEPFHWIEYLDPTTNVNRDVHPLHSRGSRGFAAAGWRRRSRERQFKLGRFWDEILVSGFALMPLLLNAGDPLWQVALF